MNKRITKESIKTSIFYSINTWIEEGYMFYDRADTEIRLTKDYSIQFNEDEDEDGEYLDISLVEDTGDYRFPTDTLTSCQFYSLDSEMSEDNDSNIETFINEIFDILNK